MRAALLLIPLAALAAPLAFAAQDDPAMDDAIRARRLNVHAPRAGCRDVQ